MPANLPKLADQFKAYLAEQPPERRAAWGSANRADSRCISRLAARGVTTLGELAEALPNLPPRLKEFGISWLGRKSPVRSPDTEAVLLRLMRTDRASRITCAWVLGGMEGRRSIHEFLKIGKAQIAAAAPDLSWLDAVIHGLKHSDKPEAV